MKCLKDIIELRNYFINEIRNKIPYIKINGDLENRLPGNVNISFLYTKGKDIVKPRAPGQKYRHYAPKAQLVLFLYSNDMTQRVNEMYDKLTKENKKVGILTVDENLDKYNADIILSLGTIKDLETIAHNLFKYIRQIDNLGVDVILCEGVKEEGIGLAIMNRLRKSSGGNIA